jgi:hypothetical protein
MASNQRDFRKDKPKTLRVRTVCRFTPLENIARNDSVNPLEVYVLVGQTLTISFLMGVKILTIYERPAIESQDIIKRIF